MVARYCAGKVPARPAAASTAALGEAASELLVEHALARYEELDFAGALGDVWGHVSSLNQAIVQTEPWSLAKDPARRGELDAFLYRLLEGVRLVAVLASPVVPRAAARIFSMLGLGEREPGSHDLAWGRLEPGTPLGTVAPLFPRVEKANDAKENPVSESTPPPAPKPEAASPPPPPPSAAAAAPDRIDIGEFAKVELRAAKITEAEKIAGSKKLVRLQVDLGGETRQVVAGIAESYEPAALVGKTIVLVANLKPAKLMGVESNGMVLAGSVEGKAVLCTFDSSVAPGTKVK
jgi:methionyl-tRNA synthetase